MSAAIGWNRRMHPSTNDRLPLLGSVVGWPHSPRSPFKTYQGTAHAVPASAVAAHSARSRADAEQHGLLSILGDCHLVLTGCFTSVALGGHTPNNARPIPSVRVQNSHILKASRRPAGRRLPSRPYWLLTSVALGVHTPFNARSIPSVRVQNSHILKASRRSRLSRDCVHTHKISERGFI